jgi:hypothetical protein
MTILKNIVVTNGTYTTRDGQEKKRYVIIGQVHSGQHGDYVTLDAHVNLAGFERKEGDTRVFANLYDPKPREGDRPRETPQQPDFKDSDVPW